MKRLIPTALSLTLSVMGHAQELSTEQIQELIKLSSKQTALELKRLEDEELKIIPDVLDCDRMKWMSSCVAINKQAKRHPEAPIRVHSKEGVEHNFPPGTPATVIHMILEGTPQAAKAFLDQHDAHMGQFKRAANAYQEELWARGGMVNASDVHETMAALDIPEKIDLSKINMYVFTSSTCGACDVQLRHLIELKDRQPQLKLFIYQIDQDKEAFNKKVVSNGLNGRILSPSEAGKVFKQGVAGTPTTWIEYKDKKRRVVLNGAFGVRQLEQQLLGASKYEG